ncbi:MAG: amylo-alpha-1,6-glucosidase [Ignavibacteria bacterium]
MKTLREIETYSTDECLEKEWLITNGLGGYASGTIAGISTRRYHALLIAALPAPLGRIVMFNTMSYEIKTENGSSLKFSGLIKDHDEHSALNLAPFKFFLEDGLPVWQYKLENFLIEKRILMPYMQNTVVIRFKVIEGNSSLRIKLFPYLHFRPHEFAVNEKFDGSFKISIDKDRYQITFNDKLPPLNLILYGNNCSFIYNNSEAAQSFYEMEHLRGYESEGLLWNPGSFMAKLSKDNSVSLIASTEAWETILSLKPEEVFRNEMRRRIELITKSQSGSDNFLSELTLASDQFLITPVGRQEKAIKVAAIGGELKSVIAGYHWFTDWGRDTMISLEGLALLTGRSVEAHSVLHSFANSVQDGLIPNHFPEGEKEGLYHTADATLWFFHALDRYLHYTKDKSIIILLLPILKEIVGYHLGGTRFGIKVDSSDGLLMQGAEGYQLTWMDAKVGDWVVTPRRGKAVEINALWYNALKLISEWIKEIEGDDPGEYLKAAELTKKSFNKKFWISGKKYLYDVVEGEKKEFDDSLRPNQIFAISLKYPVLEEDKWEDVIGIVKENLLTPFGLRSLASNHPDFKANYFGNLLARDAAYHQGTVWAWLIGHFIDAWLKLYPDDLYNTEKFLEGFDSHLSDAGIGSISEIFDAEKPYTPRGCIAQAWSVAEVLRSRVKINSLKQNAELKFTNHINT